MAEALLPEGLAFQVGVLLMEVVVGGVGGRQRARHRDGPWEVALPAC